MNKVTKKVAEKVVEMVSQGLCKGFGKRVPGNCCVEVAVCLAMGLPPTDDPPCVGKAVRSFKISLNDSCWSSNVARGKGMIKLAVAQLGSNEIDQVEFATRLAMKIVNVFLPKVLRLVQLEKEAVACESAEDLVSARTAAYNASYSASNAAAYNAAYSASNAAANAAYNAADSAADAANAADSAPNAADSAPNAADSASNAKDEMLSFMAELGLQVLQEMKSPGCKWLYLIDGKKGGKSNWVKSGEKLADELLRIFKDNKKRSICDTFLQECLDRKLSLGRIGHGRRVLEKKGLIRQAEDCCDRKGYTLVR